MALYNKSDMYLTIEQSSKIVRKSMQGTINYLLLIVRINSYMFYL